MNGLMPGTYRVRAAAPVTPRDARRHGARARRSAGARATGARSRTRARGHRHRREGGAVVGANVIAAEGEDWARASTSGSAATNEKGAYALKASPRGRMTIYLDRPGKPLLIVGARASRRRRGFEIRLRPGGTISGTVTDEDGKPVAKAEVRTAMQESWSPMAAVTDKEGKFELADVPAGPIAYFRIECARLHAVPRSVGAAGRARANRCARARR